MFTHGKIPSKSFEIMISTLTMQEERVALVEEEVEKIVHINKGKVGTKSGKGEGNNTKKGKKMPLLLEIGADKHLFAAIGIKSLIFSISYQQDTLLDNGLTLWLQDCFLDHSAIYY